MGIVNHWDELRVFQSGDKIVFQTCDPVKYPLPDPAFLLVRMMVAKLALPQGGGIATEEDEWYHEPECLELSGFSSSSSDGSLHELITPYHSPPARYTDIAQAKRGNDNSNFWLDDWIAQLPT